MKTKRATTNEKPPIEYDSLRSSYLELLKAAILPLALLPSVILLYGLAKHRPKLDEGLFMYTYPFKVLVEVGDHPSSDSIIIVLGIAMPVLFGAIESLVRAEHHDRNYTEYREALLRLLVAVAGTLPICMLVLALETVKGLITPIAAFSLLIVLAALLHMTALAVKHSGKLVDDKLAKKRDELGSVNSDLRQLHDLHDVRFRRLVFAYLIVCALHVGYFALVGRFLIVSVLFVLCTGIGSLVLGIVPGSISDLSSRYDKWSFQFTAWVVLTVLFLLSFTLIEDEFWLVNCVMQVLFFSFYVRSTIARSFRMQIFHDIPTAYGTGLRIRRVSLIKKSENLTAEVLRLEAESRRAKLRRGRSLRNLIIRLLSYDN